jgi:hypothetical protein
VSSIGEKNLYHPKFKVDDMVLAKLMDMEIPFYSEQIIIRHQLSNCSSHVVVVEYAFNFLGHHQHLYRTTTTTTTITLPICSQDVCHLQILFGH